MEHLPRPKEVLANGPQAGDLGFEPRILDPESSVIPFHQSPVTFISPPTLPYTDESGDNLSSCLTAAPAAREACLPAWMIRTPRQVAPLPPLPRPPVRRRPATCGRG